MNSFPLSQWRTSFASVLFETDQGRLKSRITDASGAIDERLRSLGGVGTIERKSIETAQRSLATFEREPEAPFVPGLRLENTTIVTRRNSSDMEAKRPQYGVGSQVRATLPSGEMIEGEIVVIFTASSGKNILVALGKRFERISPEQILEGISTKA
jgi:hypothetical protein